MHERLPFNENKYRQLCETSSDSIVTAILYTKKELVMTETSIFDSHKVLYIPEIQKLGLHLPHVQMIGKNHCVNLLQESFNNCAYFHDVLCCRYYSERVVASFSHQIQPG